MKNLIVFKLSSVINLLSLALVLVFISCENQDNIIPDNPYDFIGEEHNQMLTNFETQHSDAFNQIQNPLEAEEFVIQKIYGDESEKGFSELYDAKNLLGLSEEEALSGYDFMNIPMLCEAFAFSDKVNAILCPTLEELITLDGNDQNDQIHNVIRDAEGELIETSQDEEGYMASMVFLAVAKHSADHHIEFKAIGKPKWWQVVLADCAGAAVGLIGGGTVSVPLSVACSTAVLSVE